VEELFILERNQALNVGGRTLILERNQALNVGGRTLYFGEKLGFKRE